MPDRISDSSTGDEPMSLDAVRDELGRAPVMGRESDRELFLDLPAGGLAVPHIAERRGSPDRELLANDFSPGL